MASEQERTNATEELKSLKLIGDRIKSTKMLMHDYQHFAEARPSDDGAAEEIYHLFHDLHNLVQKTIEDFEQGCVDEYDPPK